MPTSASHPVRIHRQRVWRVSRAGADNALTSDGIDVPCELSFEVGGPSGSLAGPNSYHGRILWTVLWPSSEQRCFGSSNIWNGLLPACKT